MSLPLPDASLDQLFRTARTYNGYIDQPVERDQLEAIWELLKMGPTSANCLPARLVWVTTDEAKQKLADCSGGANPPKILAAPVSVIIGMDLDFHEQLPWLFPHAYFIMAARALGLDTGPMSGFDPAKVDAAFFAETPRVKSNFISTLGYGDPATIFERSPRPDFGAFNRIA